VRCIPDLFGYESYPSGKIFERAYVGLRIMTACQFVMAAFARQQWPCTSDTPSVIGTAIIALSEAVMVVAPPTRPERCLDFQHRIDDTKRVLNNGIVSAPNSITDEFQEPRVDNCIGRKFKTISRTLVCQDQGSAIGIFVHTTIDDAWIDADVVPAYT